MEDGAMRCVALRVVPLLMEPGALANDRTSSVEKLIVRSRADRKAPLGAAYL